VADYPYRMVPVAGIAYKKVNEKRKKNDRQYF
jgi:hypothetical protein